MKKNCLDCKKEIKGFYAIRCKSCNMKNIRKEKSDCYSAPWNKGIKYKQTEEAKKNIADAVRRGFASGERVVWLKGKTWSAEMKEHFRKKTLELLASGRHKYSDTVPEKQVKAYLDSMKIEYIKQFSYEGKSFDFYLPLFDIFLEVDGDYWHGNPKYYETLNEQQKTKKLLDEEKNSILKKNNKKLVRVWQSEVNFVWRVI